MRQKRMASGGKGKTTRNAVRVLLVVPLTGNVISEGTLP
jgi:hypothetical protein